MGVLITGAAGAIGSYLFRRFRDHADCTGIDLVASPELEACDVSDLVALSRVVERVRPSAVIHCAGLMDVRGTRDPLELVRANILGLTNLCSALKGSTTSLVYMSSRGVYPWLRADRVPDPLAEDTPSSVSVERSIYDLSKLTIEGIAERYRLQYGLRAAGLRLSSTFGLGKAEATHGHQSLLNRMFAAARAGQSLRITGADQHSDFVYYGDVYQACLRIAALPGPPPSPVYNVSTGAAPLAAYASALRELYPRAALDVSDGLDYLGSGGYGYVNLSHRRATAELGYAPVYAPVLAFAEMDNLAGGARSPWTVSFAQLSPLTEPRSSACG